jgi:hypothetical protein
MEANRILCFETGTFETGQFQLAPFIVSVEIARRSSSTRLDAKNRVLRVCHEHLLTTRHENRGWQSE